MSGVMMWPYSALLLVVNTTRLPEHTQPGWARVATQWWASGFFGYFSVLLIGSVLAEQGGLSTFATSASVVGSGPGGYLLFAVYGVVQTLVVVTSIRGKRRTRGTVDAVDEASGPLH
jgi:hypothetical protein